jgi:ATP/maltotriose-dependent transcriptional regulator MalT
VKTHLLHLYAKLGVSNRAAAVGYDRGLLPRA